MSTWTPAEIILRLQEIDEDLQQRTLDLEAAAMAWFQKKREREQLLATAFISAEGSVAERHARADRDHATVGALEEAQYEALKAVVRTLEARSAIGMSLLKVQR